MSDMNNEQNVGDQKGAFFVPLRILAFVTKTGSGTEEETKELMEKVDKMVNSEEYKKRIFDLSN
ncbi:MAG: hypothetical protein ABEK17_04205, partial [Candidatus Aenigmatarchaeota archaeon]